MAGSLDEDNALYGLIAHAVEISRRQEDLSLPSAARGALSRPFAADRQGRGVFAQHPARKRPSDHPAIAARSRKRQGRGGRRRAGHACAEGFGRDSILNIAGQPVLPPPITPPIPSIRAGMEPPLGSGAYKIGAFEQGRYIAYERVADYWAKDLPVNVGQNNFDLIRYEYFGERAVGFEAFKSGTSTCTNPRPPRNGRRAMIFPPCATAASRKWKFPTGAAPASRAFSSICAARCSRTRASARLWATASISNGPTATCFTAPISAPTAISKTPT